MRFQHLFSHVRRVRSSMMLAVIVVGLLSAFGQPVGADGVGLPVRIIIPTINLNAAIESVGLTADGSMDVPSNFDDTAWYQLGPRPGESGNAVIAGHVDSAVQGTAVFWNLRNLAPGDGIVVVSDDGTEHHFVVIRMERYDDATAPLNRIFGAADGTHLNLITCDTDSPFDKRIRSYLGSMVVYTDAAA